MAKETSVGAAPPLHGRVVEPGTRVRLRDDEGESELLLVEPADADARAGRVSSESPLGRALVGRCAGDRVMVRAPAGRREVSIVGVVSEGCL